MLSSISIAQDRHYSRIIRQVLFIVFIIVKGRDYGHSPTFVSHPFTEYFWNKQTNIIKYVNQNKTFVNFYVRLSLLGLFLFLMSYNHIFDGPDIGWFMVSIIPVIIVSLIGDLYLI